MYLPVCFIEDDNLVTAGGQRDLLLCKSLDPIADHIDTWMKCQTFGVRWILKAKDGIYLSRHSRSIPRLLPYKHHLIIVSPNTESKSSFRYPAFRR